MLKMLTKKICPLLTLAMATMGCGKQITEESPAADRIVQNQELPSALVINLNSNNGPETLYLIPENANILMPESLRVSGDDLLNKTVVIYYNFDSSTAEFDYQCTYKSTVTGNTLNLFKCFNDLGEELTMATEYEFPIYYSKKIKMELKDFASNISIDAIYTVDWK